MIVKGVRVEKVEKESLGGFLPDSPGAVLLGRILLQLEQDSTILLKNPASSLEAVRYQQGYLKALQDFHGIVYSILGTSWNEETEESVDAEEEVIDVDF